MRRKLAAKRICDNHIQEPPMTDLNAKAQIPGRLLVTQVGVGH